MSERFPNLARHQHTRGRWARLYVCARCGAIGLGEG